MSSKQEAILVVDYKRRFIWLDSGEKEAVISSSLASGVIGMLKKLDSLSNEMIIFYIRGRGGDVYAMMRVAVTIEAMRSPVTFVPFDFVRSASFWVTQYGRMRLSLGGTKFMFHRAAQSVRVDYKTLTQVDCLVTLDRLKLVDGIQLWAYSRRGRPISKIAELLLGESILTTEMAIKYRLIDGLYDEKDFDKDKKIAIELAKKKYG